MKDFLKYTLATIAGLVSFTAIVGMFGLTALIGLIASSSTTTKISDDSILSISLSGAITEQGEDNIMRRITNDEQPTLGLNDILLAVKNAASEPKVKGIYLEMGPMDASYATLQEIRNALADFKKSGKWVVTYADTYTQAAYYVASVADKVWINPKGMLDWHGLGSKPMFFKDLLAKFGVRYQVVKVGKFKSFTETYTEDKMSDANRSQVSRIVGGTWDNILTAVAKSRKVNRDSLNAYADRMLMFEPTENLMRYHMVDDMMYGDDVKYRIKKMLGIDRDDDINALSISDMLYADEPSSDSGQVAVYHAYGSIVQDGSSSLMSQEHNIVAADVCADLESLMDDDDVKAVVIRINSGGGDAYASEQLWHQVMKLKAKKPVVVSMGDMAASGAYYMSCAANWIVAQPTTMTGSIGIFAAIPDLSGLMTKKLGVKFDEVKTNRNSNFGNIMARPMSDEEVRIVQGYVNRGYELFRKRVADGRRQSVQDIEKVAQGHVWLGQDALPLHLVDQLGGLDTAIAKAVTLAKIDEYHITEYPAPTGLADQLLGMMNGGSYIDSQLRTTLGDMYEPFATLRNLNKRETLQAQMPIILNMR